MSKPVQHPVLSRCAICDAGLSDESALCLMCAHPDEEEWRAVCDRDVACSPPVE
jgi:hypothetical protein